MSAARAPGPAWDLTAQNLAKTIRHGTGFRHGSSLRAAILAAPGLGKSLVRWTVVGRSGARAVMKVAQTP